MKRGEVGSGLISLMIALAVSMGIVLAAMRLIAHSNAEYQRVEQLALMEEQANYVFDLIARSLQQAGHVDATRPMPSSPARPFAGALDGLDNSTVTAGTEAISVSIPGAHLGSDVLAVHFAGDASGAMRNCAGFVVPPSLTGIDERLVSIFHVALDALGEPELRCKYRGSAQWTSQAIATGIESFQLLFGVDADGDGLPNDFVSASRLKVMAADTPSSQPSIHTRIVAVHVALLLRSAQPVNRQLMQAIDLFGPGYADRHAADDPGTRIVPAQLDPHRLHRHFDAVIFLNNSLRPDA